MNKCGECKYLTGEKTTVGIGCEHPDRPFKLSESNVAKYKYKSTVACKRFERSEDESLQGIPDGSD